MLGVASRLSILSIYVALRAAKIGSKRIRDKSDEPMERAEELTKRIAQIRKPKAKLK
jgi:hypothetical protein